MNDETLTLSAKTDLEEIWTYIAADKPGRLTNWKLISS